MNLINIDKLLSDINNGLRLKYSKTELQRFM